MRLAPWEMVGGVMSERGERGDAEEATSVRGATSMRGTASGTARVRRRAWVVDRWKVEGGWIGPMGRRS